VKRESVGVGLMGLGVVGGGVAQVLTERTRALAEQVGCPLVLRKVKVIESDLARPQVKEMGLRLFTTDEEEFFNSPDIDIVVEAIGGERPAFDYQKRALASGRHVVTSNKEVVAKHGAELFALAQKNGVGLHYEASVGGGIPLIAPFQQDLVANRIGGIYAIINGTTNYILTRMAGEGIDFPRALKSAQKLGYAEADPKNDIEGIDSTYKLAILASLAFHIQVHPQDIHTEGISRMNSSDFRYASELGYAIKLLAIAKESDNQIEVRVHPAFIPQDSLLAEVDGVYNAILVEGDLVGRVLFYGRGAGAEPTSSAIVADVVSAARDIVTGGGCRMRWRIEPGKTVRPMAELETAYYLRLTAADQPGVLAQVSRVLGDHLISISSVIQKAADARARTAEIVIMTHPAREAEMQKALAELGRLKVVREIGNFIRVEK